MATGKEEQRTVTPAEAMQRIKELAERRENSRVIIALVGAPGAGKSTFANAVVNLLNEEEEASAQLFPMDGFHLSNAELERIGKRQHKGRIDTFDAYGYLACGRRIANAYQQEDVFVPIYSRIVHEPIAAGLCINRNTRLIVSEGNYLLDASEPWCHLVNVFEEIWFLDADPQILEERLVARHAHENMDSAQARDWCATVDMPNAQRIATSRDRADWCFTPAKLDLSQSGHYH